MPRPLQHDYRVQFRLSRAEYDQWRDIALAMGFESLSEWVRGTCNDQARQDMQALDLRRRHDASRRAAREGMLATYARCHPRAHTNGRA